MRVYKASVMLPVEASGHNVVSAVDSLKKKLQNDIDPTTNIKIDVLHYDDDVESDIILLSSETLPYEDMEKKYYK